MADLLASDFSFNPLHYRLIKIVHPTRSISMKKISSFALVSSLVLASSAAFAGGMVDPVTEPAPVVITEDSSSSAVPLWAIIGGVVVVGAVLSSSN
jgi:hypothetical protein